MNSNTATSRYVTSDFRSSPLLALTDLLGLQQYAVDIIKAPEFYGPVLSGITVFRHLSPAEKMSINRRIVEGEALWLQLSDGSLALTDKDSRHSVGSVQRLSSSSRG